MKKNDRRKRKLQEEACDYEIERTPTTRYEPDYEEGLTSAQAEEHRRDGWGNISVDPPAQTTEEIITEKGGSQAYSGPIGQCAGSTAEDCSDQVAALKPG